MVPTPKNPPPTKENGPTSIFAGIDELTIDFLAIKHDVSNLIRTASTHIDVEEDKHRDDCEGREEVFPSERQKPNKLYPILFIQ